MDAIRKVAHLSDDIGRVIAPYTTTRTLPAIDVIDAIRSIFSGASEGDPDRAALALLNIARYHALTTLTPVERANILQFKPKEQ